MPLIDKYCYSQPQSLLCINHLDIHSPSIHSLSKNNNNNIKYQSHYAAINKTLLKTIFQRSKKKNNIPR